MYKIFTLILCTQISNLYSLDKVVTVIRPRTGIIIAGAAATAGGLIGNYFSDPSDTIEDKAPSIIMGAIAVGAIPALMVRRRSPNRVFKLTCEAFDWVTSHEATTLALRPESFKELTPLINRKYVNSPVPLGKFQYGLIKRKMELEAIQEQLNDEAISAALPVIELCDEVSGLLPKLTNRLIELQQYPDVMKQCAILMRSKDAKRMREQLDDIETSIWTNTAATMFKK